MEMDGHHTSPVHLACAAVEQIMNLIRFISILLLPTLYSFSNLFKPHFLLQWPAEQVA